MNIPQIRIIKTNGAPIRPEMDYVLYWMTAYRRTAWNYSLDRAVWWSKELGKPLVVLEALRCGYKWANDRLHRFVLEGMAANRESSQDKSVLYYPYVEKRPDEGKGLVIALSQRACVVITDDFPAFFLPRMIASASARLMVRLEKVDSNGLLPMRESDKIFTTAHAFRRFLQKRLPEHLV